MPDSIHLSVTQLTHDLAAYSGPLTRRLMSALRDGVRNGDLPADAVLPPSRTLAAELGCSRWVVTETYGQLVAEGYLSSTTGSGTRVRNLGGTAPGPPHGDLQPAGRPRFDLAPGIADLAGFPRSRWAESYRRAVAHRQTDLLSDTSLVSTVAARGVITDHLRRTRHVREDPGQLSLTTSATAAAGWVARLLVSLGHRRIAVEDPSWPGVREAASRSGLQSVPIDVDDEGLCVGQLADHDLRAVIVTPAHQFPTGVAMSAERRVELINWAERVDGVIIEDDYDAEFRYDSRPIASLQGMAPDRVVLLGSLSKSLSPAIGVGWMIMPQWLILRILADDLDRGTGASVFAVDALSIMIENGWYERHLRSMRSSYRKRRAALVQAIADLLPQCRVRGMEAGMHLLLDLPAGTDAAVVVRRARELDVGVVDLDRYRIRPANEPALVLGFGNLRSGRERQAVTLLRDALG